MEEEQTKTTLKLNCQSKNFIDRYFDRSYVKLTHTYYFVHSNGLVVSGLSKCHPALSSEITSFKCLLPLPREGLSDKGQLVSGKKKHGGIQLSKGQRLFEIEAGGVKYIIRSCIKAIVLELNEAIMKGDYKWLKERPEEAGYLFIADLNSNHKLDEQELEKTASTFREREDKPSA